MPAVRVLVCEDSRAYAAALQRMLEYDGDITVPAICATAEEAIAALPLIKPDLVTMDGVLPGMDGLAAIGEIMSSRPLPILVLAAGAGAGSDRAAAALAAGALEILAKDDLDVLDPAGAAGVAFRQRVKMLSRVRVIHHLRAGPGDTHRMPGGAHRVPGDLRAPGVLRVPGALRGPDAPRGASVIGICASTGGPQTLVRLLKALPADYPIPLLIVQHIAAGFTEGLARWLDQSSLLPVGIGTHGARIAPGAWIAPEGAHLRLTSAGRLSLDRQTVAGHHRPSGDILLESIAMVAGRGGVAIVLSGMGRDGAVGAAAVRDSGGLAIAQDEASSAIYGMPKAAVDRGIDVILSPDSIAARLLRLSRERLPGMR